VELTAFYPLMAEMKDEPKIQLKVKRKRDAAPMELFVIVDDRPVKRSTQDLSTAMSSVTLNDKASKSVLGKRVFRLVDPDDLKSGVRPFSKNKAKHLPKSQARKDARIEKHKQVRENRVFEIPASIFNSSGSNQKSLSKSSLTPSLASSPGLKIPAELKTDPKTDKTVVYENLLFEYLNSVRSKDQEDVYDVYEEDTGEHPSIPEDEFIRASAIARFDPVLDKLFFPADDAEEEDEIVDGDEDENAEDHPNNDYPDEEEEDDDKSGKGSSDEEDPTLSPEDHDIVSKVRGSIRSGKGTELSDEEEELSVEYDEEI